MAARLVQALAGRVVVADWAAAVVEQTSAVQAALVMRSVVQRAADQRARGDKAIVAAGVRSSQAQSPIS